MGVGRFLCVALPLVLTLASLVALLYATLAGVSHHNLRLFRINTTDLSISPADAAGLAARAPSKTANITAADLGLADYYDVTLWNFCAFTSANHSRSCSPHAFDWASKQLATSNLTTAAGIALQLPTPVRDALTAFKTVTRWAEIVAIAAAALLAVEVLLGAFATVSRAVSCVTWLESSLAAALVAAAAGLATALALIVVGVADSTTSFYGVRASLDPHMLAVVWISTAFALAASLFWVLTVCCCKPEARPKRARATDQEKLLPSAFASHKYEPLQTPQHMASTAYVPNPGRTDLAYEPFSHRR